MTATHGHPNYYNCTIPGCSLDGHKCSRQECADPIHTHPMTDQAVEALAAALRDHEAKIGFGHATSSCGPGCANHVLAALAAAGYAIVPADRSEGLRAALCVEHGSPAEFYSDGGARCLYCCTVETSCDCHPAPDPALDVERLARALHEVTHEPDERGNVNGWGCQHHNAAAIAAAYKEQE